jgi:hypothetical protein
MQCVGGENDSCEMVWPGSGAPKCSLVRESSYLANPGLKESHVGAFKGQFTLVH